MQLSKGTLLQNGKYRIENVLGQGGFGITYLARQEILEREVCIKEFFMRDFCNRSETNSSVTLGTTANKELMERYLNKFIKEARTIAALEHPNIIHIHDIFKENDTAYYVMDYIEGESLAEMVKRRGPLPEEEAVAYIRSIADALKYVHERSINHLDVKPGNIMVRRADSRVFLLDFGLSKQYDTAGNQTSSTPLGISHGFAPIEQYSPEGIKAFSPQTDIYSLGATLYYLITGATPPPASELFASELEGFPSTISASVKEAVGQAMKPQKKERPQSVNEFLKLLPQSAQPESSVQTAFQESEKTEQTTSAAEEETSLLQDVKTPDQQDMVKDEPQNTSNQQLYDFEVEDPRRKRTKIIAWSVGIVAMIFICFQFFGTDGKDFLTDYNQLQIGDYYYSDGSFSHEINDQKDCVGVVFSLETTKEEKARGWTHGYIIALSDAQNGTQLTWGPEGGSIAQYCLKEEEALKDLDGYAHSIDHTRYSNYEAFMAAINYPVMLPKGKTSGWYLPSLGQLKMCIENLSRVHWRDDVIFDIDSVINEKINLVDEDRYNENPLIYPGLWSSTETNWIAAWLLNITPEWGSYQATNKTGHYGRVRPIAAF